MKILFRIDDIYLNGNAFEAKLFEVFDKHNIPLSVGVIPFDSYSKPFITESRLSDLPQSVEVCLHGYMHKKNGRKGEFDGLELQKQSEMIRAGKELLESRCMSAVTTFIPPWNAYDLNTLQACSDNGMVTLSCGYSTIGSNEIPIVEVPVSLEHFYLFQTKLVTFLCGFLRKRTDLLLIVLFHPYNFVEISEQHFNGTEKRFQTNFSELEQLLLRLKKQGHTFLAFHQLHGRRYFKSHLFLNKIAKHFYNQNLFLYK